MERRTLGDGHRLTLGMFSPNCSSGCAATQVPERWDGTWAHNLALARLAEEAGIDFILPVARWRGYRGPTNFEGYSLEALTWACGLLAKTTTLKVFGTVHAALLHPVFAAKQMATADQIGEGRFGLNIVCGWNPDEFDMFGLTLRQHDDRYAYGAEWWQIVQRLWSEPKEFDFAGKFFDLKGLIGEPKPWGGTRPVVMNAGSSTTGLAFAVDNCDLLFTTLADLERGRATVARIRAMAEAQRRSVKILTTSYVVCRPTRREAEEYHRYYAEENGDWEAVDHWYDMQSAHTKGRPPELRDVFRLRFAGGHGAYPIIGAPDDVADRMAEMLEIGFGGTTVAFVNYLDEFPFFAAEVLPRLERRGLRSKTHG